MTNNLTVRKNIVVKIETKDSSPGNTYNRIVGGIRKKNKKLFY